MNQTRLTTKLEIKKLSNMQFEGQGSVFGNVDLGGDVVMPGAFKRTLAQHKSEGTLPSMFWMHDPSRIAGKWLEMEETDTGLQAKGELAPTDLGKEIHTLLKMEAVKGLSIGYIPTDMDWDSDGVRLINEVDLIEVSVVSIPMNPKAQIQHVKSRLSAKGEYVPTDEEVAELKRDSERFLQRKGFSRRMAQTCAANLFNNLLDLGEMPEPDEIKTSATPEEIEVLSGLYTFKVQETAYELNSILDKYFRS